MVILENIIYTKSGDKVIWRRLSLKNITISDYINIMNKEPIKLLDKVRITIRVK